MPDPQTSSAPALPSARSAPRPLLSRLAEMQWALIGLGLALLVLLVLPSAQIKLGASQLNGLIGSYTSGGGGWVPCDANGNPLPSGDPGLNSDGSAALLHTGNQPTASNTYPVPQTGAPSWWYGCYSPQAPGGGSYPNGGYPGGGLTSTSTAGNTTQNYPDGTVGYYDPVYYSGDRPGNSPTPPNLNGTVTTTGNDTLTAHFLWTGAGPPPSPATFIIQTSVTATASVGYGSSGKTSGLSGKAVATLGSDTVTATAGDAGSVGSASGGSYQAQQVSPSGNIAMVSLSASVSTTTKNTLGYATWTGSPTSTYYYNGPGAGTTTATATATDKASAYPVTINLDGTTPVNNRLEALVGQQIAASVNCPVGMITSYNWAATGNVFKTYYENASSNQKVALSSNNGDYAGPSFYFYDVTKDDSLTVTCYPNIKFPDGNVQNLSLTSQSVTFKKPSTVWWVKEGFIQPFTLPQYPNYQLYGLATDPATASQYSDGEDWYPVTVTIPAGFPTAGQGSFTQLVTPNHTATHSGVVTPIISGPQGLDNMPEFGQWTLPGQGAAGDSPDIPTNSAINAQFSAGDQQAASDQFTTYVMFRPPAVGNRLTIWAPLQSYSWSARTTITYDGSQWHIVPTQSTPMSPSAATVKGTDTNDPPQWSHVYTNVGL